MERANTEASEAETTPSGDDQLRHRAQQMEEQLEADVVRSRQLDQTICSMEALHGRLAVEEMISAHETAVHERARVLADHCSESLLSAAQRVASIDTVLLSACSQQVLHDPRLIDQPPVEASAPDSFWIDLSGSQGKLGTALNHTTTALRKIDRGLRRTEALAHIAAERLGGHSASLIDSLERQNLQLQERVMQLEGQLQDAENQLKSGVTHSISSQDSSRGHHETPLATAPAATPPNYLWHEGASRRSSTQMEGRVTAQTALHEAAARCLSRRNLEQNGAVARVSNNALVVSRLACVQVRDLTKTPTLLSAIPASRHPVHYQPQRSRSVPYSPGSSWVVEGNGDVALLNTRSGSEATRHTPTRAEELGALLEKQFCAYTTPGLEPSAEPAGSKSLSETSNSNLFAMSDWLALRRHHIANNR